MLMLIFDDFNESIRLRKMHTTMPITTWYVYLMQGNNKLGCSEAQNACQLGNCKLLEMAKSKGYCR